MNKLAVVTGASSGIGEAYAECLARDGWDLVVIARRLSRLDALASRLGDGHGVEIRPIQADLADHTDLERVCEEIASLPVELLINNAALAHYRPFVELPPEESEELVHLNVLAPVRLAQAALPGMRERPSGAIINVASLLAFSGTLEGSFMPQRAVYAASKSFLVTFTQILASELRNTGIRMQLMCPGVVRSEFHSRQGMDMSSVDRMAPQDVVHASLLDLERGVLVSMPGVADEKLIDAVGQANAQIMAFARTTQLPDRYR